MWCAIAPVDTALIPRLAKKNTQYLNKMCVIIGLRFPVCIAMHCTVVKLFSVRARNIHSSQNYGVGWTVAQDQSERQNKDGTEGCYGLYNKWRIFQDIDDTNYP